MKKTTKTKLNPSIYFISILCLLLVNSVVLSYFAKNNPYFPFDLNVTRFVQSYNFALGDSVLKLVSIMGNPIPGFAILTAFTLYLLFDNYKKEALFLLISSLSSVLLSLILKFIIQRPRPSPDLVIQLGNYAKFDSFPSGHVMFFIGFFGFIYFLTFKKIVFIKFRSIILPILMCLLSLIGLSRIYLGAHWFSDVLGAYFIGIFWLLTICTLYILHSVRK